MSGLQGAVPGHFNLGDAFYFLDRTSLILGALAEIGVQRTKKTIKLGQVVLADHDDVGDGVNLAHVAANSPKINFA